MLKYICFSLLCLFICRPAEAQILNVEKSRTKADSAHYFLGSVGINFNTNNRSINEKGETIVFIGLAADSDVAYISELHSFLLLTQFQYNATTDAPINSTGYGHFRINFLRKQKLSYETFTQLQYDQGRGMKSRWLGGSGIRYRFFDHENASLYAGTGVMYEREVWGYPLLEASRTINIWKSTNYLSSRIKITENANFNIIAYYQTGYDSEHDFFRHRISADANLLINLTSKLAFRATAGFAFENRPIVPVSKLVYSVMNGIQVSF